MKSIKRRKVSNVAQENSKKGKPAAETCQIYFIRILVIISNSTPFNLRYVMIFPITENPLCITHSGGSGLKTEKRKLLNKLEELQDGFTKTPLPQTDVTLVDGGLLIHSLLSAIGNIASYGNLARTLLA